MGSSKTDRFEIRAKRELSTLRSPGCTLFSDGGQVAIGYKPDRVYVRRGYCWIVEFESSTSRKGFIGGYLKAQKYLSEARGSNGALIFVINENNCNLKPVAQQIAQYHYWLKKQGITVQPTYLMYDRTVVELATRDISLFSRQFLSVADKIA